jgi:transcriptional regulator with XRE-family HTH domain
MSQRKLAERAGVSHSLISYIEKDERSLTPDVEEKIWLALNLDSIAVAGVLELHRDILNLSEAC